MLWRNFIKINIIIIGIIISYIISIINKMAPQPTVVKKKNRRAKKKDKGFRLIFDRNKRIEFVTGFKKRKDERRVQAKEMEKDEKREARKEIAYERKKQRDLVDEQYE